MATITQTPARPAAVQTPGAGPGKILGRVGLYLIMTVIALIFMVPLFWMISTSFKPKSQLFSAVIYWIPKTITTKNYENLLANPATPIARWFVNSLIVGIAVTILILLVDSLAAYAYARMEFPGRRILFT